MAGRALVEGTRSMIVFLFRAIVFPLAWVWAMGIAKRHEDSDRKARRKVATGIVAGLVLTAGVGFILYDFQEDARTGMYERLNDSLKQVYGAAAYESQGKEILAKGVQVDILERQLAAAMVELEAFGAAGNVTAYEAVLENVITFETNLDIAHRDLEAATTYQDRLTQENRFYDSIQGHIARQDDDAIFAAAQQRQQDQTPADPALAEALLDAEKEQLKARTAYEEARVAALHYDLLDDVRPLTTEEQDLADAARAELIVARDARDDADADAGAALSAARASGMELPVPTSVYLSEELPMRTTYWLNVKLDAESDMGMWMNFLLLPGLIGVFYAPLFIALGSIMANAWEPSDSIGYKKYPAGALGLFLFFGAFGWPALLFSAWGFWDIDVRSKEGQISL